MASSVFITFSGGHFQVPGQATGDLLVAASPTSWTALADVAVGQVLISGGVGVAPSYSASPLVTTLELGHASDTTLARVSAGVIAVEGNTVAMLGTANVFAALQTIYIAAGSSYLHIKSPNTTLQYVTYGDEATYGWRVGRDTTTGGITGLNGAYFWFEIASATNKMSLSTTGNLAVAGGGAFTGDITRTGANAQTSVIKQSTVQSGTMSGATLTLTNLLPAGSVVIGVTIHPTTAITSGDGATTYTVGDGTDVDRWGTGIAFAADVTLANATITSLPIYAAATNVVLTATAGTFSGGVVRATVHYLTVTAATS